MQVPLVGMHLPRACPLPLREPTRGRDNHSYRPVEPPLRLEVSIAPFREILAFYLRNYFCYNNWRYDKV